MRILRGVGSRTLPCGCLIGFYETYDNKTIAVVDARGASCTNTAHRVDTRITVDIADATQSLQMPVSGSR
jgi:hypothetical protein